MRARTRLTAGFVAFAAAAAVALVGGSSRTATAAPGESSTPIANPNLPSSCGLDVLLILDESGSVANFKGDIQKAYRAFTSALKNTGSRIAVEEFSSVARLPLPGAANRAYTTVTNDTIATIFEPYIATGYSPDGRTHWEDAFRVGRYFLPRPSAARPHMVVFITDGDPNQAVNETGPNRVTFAPGNPNVAQNEYELKVPLLDNEQSQTTEDAAKTRAVSNANAMKAMGSHVLAVAVGAGLSSSASLNRLIAVSGPDVYTGPPATFDGTKDVYRIPDFAQLEAGLRQLAFALCAPAIVVRKVIDLTPDPGTDDLIPADGWAMTATVSPTPSSWAFPPGATGNSATGTTEAGGFVHFDFRTATKINSTVTVTEQDPAGVPPGFVNDPSATRCTFRTPDIPDTPLPATVAPGSFTAVVPSEAIVTCQMVNRAPPAPAIDIEKFTNGENADAPPGPFIPVGTPISWTYLVKNTGNDTLTSVVVTDNVVVGLSCPRTTLAPGEVMTCSAGGVAQAPTALPGGVHSNIGTVTAVDPFGTPVTDQDPSNYTSVVPSINLEKLTNGLNADEGAEDSVPVGSLVTWTYVVTNTGTFDVTNIVLQDTPLGIITCPATTLAPAATMTCTATGLAQAGPYENVATVTGDVFGATVSDTDVSHYFGEVPGITIQKTTNGVDANTPPEAPLVSVGDPVAWLYQITNTGNVPLRWSVTDDQLGTVACPKLLFIAPGNSVFCFAGGLAAAGLYANIGTVVGTTPAGQTVTASDPSHYFGVQGGIQVQKLTNGVAALDPPGPFLTPGSAVTWTYQVTNTGNSDLSAITVVDSQGVAVTCPQTTLVVGGAMTCSASGIVAADQYSNIVTATGTTPVGLPVQDEDESHYFGAEPGIDLEKFTNGFNGDDAPGPFIPVGQPVHWTYVVANTGNATLSSVAVVDDKGVAVTCPQTSVAPGQEMECAADGVAQLGQYENMATVTAVDPTGATLTATDPSHYFGTVSQIAIEKVINGETVGTAPGLPITIGVPVTVTIRVTNPGNIPIRQVQVTDDEAPLFFVGGDTNTDQELDPSETWTYQADLGPQLDGEFGDVATVSALDVVEDPLTGSASAFHFGVAAGGEVIPPVGLDAVRLALLALLLTVAGTSFSVARRLRRR